MTKDEIQMYFDMLLNHQLVSLMLRIIFIFSNINNSRIVEIESRNSINF